MLIFPVFPPPFGGLVANQVGRRLSASEAVGLQWKSAIRVGNGGVPVEEYYPCRERWGSSGRVLYVSGTVGSSGRVLYVSGTAVFQWKSVIRVGDGGVPVDGGLQ